MTVLCPPPRDPRRGGHDRPRPGRGNTRHGAPAVNRCYNGGMRVMLCDPPNASRAAVSPAVPVHPMALGYLAAALSPGHDVRQLVPDIRARDGTPAWDDVEAELAAFQPELVGITAVTHSFPAALQLAALAKRACPRTTVVLGGPHASARPASAFACPDVDGVVVGEGEVTLRALADGANPIGLPGTWWRGDDGRPVPGPARAPVDDLDTIAFPRRDGVLWSDDVHPAFYQSIITLRGCPYACIYCAVPSLDDRKTRYRSPANVLDEIQFLRDQYQVPYLFFHDSVFTLNRKRTEAILHGMIERHLDVPFCCQTRVDRVDGPLLSLMRRAGCHQVFYGIESGHPETLRRMKKAVPLSQAREAVRLTLAEGIRASGFFMVGFPWETEAHLDATAEFATSIGLEALSLFSATPLPGTELERLSGVTAPPDVDFRRPEVNLTALPAARYIEMYQSLVSRFTLYNQDVSLRSSWPRG